MAVASINHAIAHHISSPTAHSHHQLYPPRHRQFLPSTCTNLNTKRYKSPQRTYHYRNIKSIDLKLFEQTILSSSLFSNPDPTVDGYANQMETELTSILDKVAPLKTGHRTGPRKAKNWLSPEAVDAKKRRRQARAAMEGFQCRT